jgi:hypothetical protein
MRPDERAHESLARLDRPVSTAHPITLTLRVLPRQPEFSSNAKVHPRVRDPPLGAIAPPCHEPSRIGQVMKKTALGAARTICTSSRVSPCATVSMSGSRGSGTDICFFWCSNRTEVRSKQLLRRCALSPITSIPPGAWPAFSAQSFFPIP